MSKSQSETPSNSQEQSTAASSGPFTPTERDEALLVYMRENFKQMKFGQDVYYAHKDGKAKCVFYVGKDGEPFELRFCKPSETLKKTLVRKVRSFYLPPEMSTEDAIKLIDQHSNDTYTQE